MTATAITSVTCLYSSAGQPNCYRFEAKTVTNDGEAITRCSVDKRQKVRSFLNYLPLRAEYIGST